MSFRRRTLFKDLKIYNVYINGINMKKLLAYIVEENIQFAHKLNAALQRTNVYETRVFADANAYLNYTGNRPDLLVMDHEVKYATTRLAQNDYGKSSQTILVLKDKNIKPDPITAYEYVLKDDFAVEKIERMAGGYAKMTKLKQENLALTKVVKMEKSYIVIGASIIIALFYSTFLMQ
jgi:hypothetical protein